MIELTLAGTDVSLDTIAEDELVQIEQINDTQVGYGLKGVAAPIISANSQWGETVRIFELQAIAEAMFRENGDPSNAIPETPANGVPATTKQPDRYAQPFYASQVRSFENWTFRNRTLYIPREIGHFVFSMARNRTL